MNILESFEFNKNYFRLDLDGYHSALICALVVSIRENRKDLPDNIEEIVVDDLKYEIERHKLGQKTLLEMFEMKSCVTKEKENDC